MKSKDFPEVLRIASALISNKELVQRAIAIIYNLLVNNKDPEVLGAAGAVDFIVEAFKAYSTDAVLGTWACAVLSLFSKSEKDVRLFIEKGGFVSFFKMYRYSFDAIDFCDKVMNSTAALCMTNFPNFPGTDPILAEIMDLTFEVLDRNKTRMPTCGYASIIMSLILRFPLKNNKLFFFGSAACGGGGSSSSSSSSNNNGDATTANTNSSSEGGEAISLKKKVSLLLGVLKRHEESKELSEKLTLMFCNLFINALPGERPSKEVEAVEVEIAKHIGEEGGVELILDILKRYMGISVAVCENATAALQNLTVWKGNLERIVKAGGTNIVLQGLREIPADKLQAKGFLQTLYKTVTALSPQKQSQQQAEGSETTKLTPSII